MDQQTLLRQPSEWRNTLDFMGAFSRSARIDILGIESGLVSIGSSRPQKACFVIYDNAYGFYFGFIPFGAGLKFKPNRMDFMIPIKDVTALHIGGATMKAAALYAASPRLHLQTGRAFLQVSSRGREAVQFAPTDTVSISDTGIMASKILAGHRTVYSAKVRGDESPSRPAPSEPIQAQGGGSIMHGPEQVLPSASRYFPQSETFDVGLESYVLPCMRYLPDEHEHVAGYLVIEQGNYGFFEPDDIESATIQGRSPLVDELNEVHSCSVILQGETSVTVPSGVACRNSAGPDGDILLVVETDDSTGVFRIKYGSTSQSAQEKASVLFLFEAVLERIGENVEPFEVEPVEPDEWEEEWDG